MRLNNCPYCGSRFKMSQEPHDNHPVEGKFYIYHEYGEIGSAARNCHIDVRGHFDTAKDAAEFWNIVPSQGFIAKKGERGEDFCIAKMPTSHA